jgi:hypothetical protein
MTNIARACSREFGTARQNDKNVTLKMMQSEDEDSVPAQEPTNVLGLERRKSEMRTMGGLLLILGAGAAHSALALTAVIIYGMGGREQVKGFNLPVLVGSMLQCTSGMGSMVVGLNTLLAASLSKTSRSLVFSLLILANMAPITIVFSIVRIVMGIQQDPSDGVFIPTYMEPTHSDTIVVGFSGVVALISVCITLLGGITLLASTLCAFIGDQCMSRNQFSYRIRYVYFNFLVAVGGLSQFLLGCFCWERFGGGPFDEAIHVTVYTIFLPQVTCGVGIIQTVVGIFGLLRGCRLVRMGGAEDHWFEYASLLSWLVTMLFQIIVQPSYAKGDAYDAEGATFASVYLGFFVVPVFLDHMVRVTPLKITNGYYAVPLDTDEKPDRVVEFILLLIAYFGKSEDKNEKSDLESTLSNDSDKSVRVVS